MALEFCRKERAKCSVFWVDATAPGTAARSFEDIGTVLAPGTNFPNPEAARNFVLKHLEASTEPLLFVFDNYDQPGEFPNVRDFFPHRAHIIFTSRHVVCISHRFVGRANCRAKCMYSESVCRLTVHSQDSKRLGTTIEIGAMPVDEAVELLLIQSGLEKTPENIKHAQSISEELGGLALAIDQAATYISARSVPLHSFNDVYARRKAAILKHTPTHWEYRKVGSGETEQSLSVFTTWEMSFEQLEARGQDRESIIHLLTLGAFIDTNNIGEGLFSLYSQQEDRPGWLSTFMADEEWDSDFYQDTVVRLLSVSLVTSIDLTSEDARFSFHPLIAEWLKLRIDAKERAEFCEEAIRVVRLFVDNGDKKEMPIRYKGETLSHMDKIMEHARAYKSAKFESNALKDATISFGSFYRRLGRYQETQTLVERAMSDESDVNPAIRNILANMYCDQGELQKSEALYFKVLTGLDHPTPEKDPGYTLLWTNQAFIYWTQDDKLRADGLAYEGAYKGDFTAFDPWYVSVLSTYNGLGVLYMKTGHLDLAEDFFTKALSGREKTMGRDDRYTAEIVNHLGALYTRLGQLDKAETLLLRALAYLDKAYGEFYMATQPTANNLGLLYLTQGRLDDAERIIHRTTGYLERGFGPTHASTLCAFHNQALLLRRLGRPNEARRLLERTIEGWEDSGEGIAKMEADSKYILADIVLSLDESKAGTSHGNTKIETGDIVDDHTKEEKKKKTGKQRAGELFHQAAELYGIALGKTHPQTVDAWNRANEIGVGDVTLSSPL